nr:MAG TPA: hypothetical protein [Bacteriophage sp.]
MIFESHSFLYSLYNIVSHSIWIRYSLCLYESVRYE